MNKGQTGSSTGQRPLLTAWKVGLSLHNKYRTQIFHILYIHSYNLIFTLLSFFLNCCYATYVNFFLLSQIAFHRQILYMYNQVTLFVVLHIMIVLCLVLLYILLHES